MLYTYLFPPSLQRMNETCRNKRSHPIPIINLFLAGLIDFEIVCNGRQKNPRHIFQKTFHMY